MNLYEELRGAVEAAFEYLESHGVGEDTYDYLNEHVGTDGDCPLIKLHKQLKNALALPRRNCDIGDADEQLKRFLNFCRIISTNETCDGCPLLPKCPTLEHCVIAWEQMPYKKGEDNERK